MLVFDCGLTAEVVDRNEAGGRTLRFAAESDPDELISSVGEVPLPPYIHTQLEDPGRYQTVYAAANGSAAAPTADCTSHQSCSKGSGRAASGRYS
jgi:S-adenosylmethionine:tRNA ribosyltransferase-isomerase